MEKLLNIQEVSDLTGLPVATLYKCICRKTIPFVKLGGRVLFSPLKIQEWIDEHSVSPIEKR